MKKILGAVSPAYALMSGEGPLAKAMGKGQLGMLPRALMKEGDRSRARRSMLAEEAPMETGRPMKKGGPVKKYKEGGVFEAGMGQPPKDIDMGSSAPVPSKKRPKNTTGSKVKVAPAKKMASGGYVRGADGCATKGKTKGTMVKMMAKGGKTC